MERHHVSGPEGIAAISKGTGAPLPQRSEQPDRTATAARATFRQVWASGEFRALWAAQVMSVAGDQLALVALTLLVYDRTRSALLAAVTFVASVAPQFAGGVVLAGLADRWPRRELMIVCDLARALLVTVMALPGVPVAGLVSLLFVVTLVGAPFTASRAALYPDILAGDTYVLGSAITFTTMQAAQVVGFGAGGVVVGVFGVHASLAADAVTFLLSAVLTLAWVRHRPAGAHGSRHSGFSMAGVRLVFGAGDLRTPMLLGCLAAFTDVYEGVAAPLARELGGGAAAAGVILASGALGSSAGSVAFGRLVRTADTDPVDVPARGGGLRGARAVRATTWSNWGAADPDGQRCALLLPAGSQCRLCHRGPSAQAKRSVRGGPGRNHAGPGHCHDHGRGCDELAAPSGRDRGSWRAGGACRASHRQDEPPGRQP